MHNFPIGSPVYCPNVIVLTTLDFRPHLGNYIMIPIQHMSVVYQAWVVLAWVYLIQFQVNLVNKMNAIDLKNNILKDQFVLTQLLGYKLRPSYIFWNLMKAPLAHN